MKTHIEQTLCSWISGRTSTLTIQTNQTKKRPALPYLSVKLISLTQIGFDDMTAPTLSGSTISQAFYNDQKAIVDINSYGSGSFNNLIALKQSIYSDTYRNQLQSRGLYPIPISQISNISEILENAAEERSHCELGINIRTQYIYDNGLIETVSGSGDIVHETLTVTSSITFTGSL